MISPRAAAAFSLPGVGLVPMLDDPEFMARTIHAVTRAAKG